LPAMASYLPTTSPLTQPFAGKRAPTESVRGVSKLCAVPTESARGNSKLHAVNCRSALARDGVVPADNVAADPTRSRASALLQNGAKACRSSAPRQWNRPAAFRNSTPLFVGARLPAMASYLQATSPLTQPFAGKRAPTEWGQDVSKDQTAPNSISPRRVETLGAPLEPVRGM